MQYNSDKLIRSLRILLAVIIAECIYHFYKEPYYTWVLITIYVILFDQYTIGGTLYRGFLRLIATISGSIIGILTIIIFKNNELANLLVILSASLIYAYIFINQKQSYIGLLGSITVTIVLIGSHGIETALYRSGNIIIGIIIAIVVTLIFFPQSAEKITINLIHKSIIKFRDTLQILLKSEADNRIIKEHFNKIESELLTELNSLVKNIEEIKYEGKVKYKTYYLNALRAIRRIYRIVTIIFQSEAYIYIFSDKEIHNKLIMLLEHFENLVSAIENKDFQLSSIEHLSFKNETTHENLSLFHKLINNLAIETDVMIKSLNLVKPKI